MQSLGYFCKKVGSQLRPPKKRSTCFYIFSVLLILILFILLFVISGLGKLRFFVPHYFELTGFPFGSRNYLVVLQNDTELRPTGGFITAYGVAKFSNGFFKGLDIYDVYGEIDEHEYVEPPYPFEELLGTDPFYQGHTFRDANFYPNFPDTVDSLTSFYNLIHPDTEFDGVVAMNFSVVEDLVGALGKLEVNDITFTKENLFERLEYEVTNIDKHNIEELEKRKSVLADFYKQLIRKVIFSPLKLRKISDTLGYHLDTKGIQLYFANPSLEEKIVEKGWGGAWPEKPSADFLAVNETNLGGMKSDRYLQRDIKYNVYIGDDPSGRVIGELIIDLKHFGGWNPPLSGRYSGYFRAFVPAGSEMLEVATNYADDLHEESAGNYKVFGNIVVLEPGESTRLYYKYVLPDSVLQDNQYSLHIEKQSGTDDHYTVSVKTPPGTGILSDDFGARENYGEYSTDLDADREVELTILPDELPPVVIWQKTLDLETIGIYFNENVSASSAADGLNYSVEDLNVNHPEVTDRIRIKSVEHQGNSVLLKVDGMTAQDEEHYRVSMRNIYDLAGNFIEPDPKIITVVQRFE